MVRSDKARRLLLDMDTHLMRLRASVGEDDRAVIGLTGTHHNLLRMWADVQGARAPGANARARAVTHRHDKAPLTSVK